MPPDKLGNTGLQTLEQLKETMKNNEAEYRRIVDECAYGSSTKKEKKEKFVERCSILDSNFIGIVDGLEKRGVNFQEVSIQPLHYSVIHEADYAVIRLGRVGPRGKIGDGGLCDPIRTEDDATLFIGVEPRLKPPIESQTHKRFFYRLRELVREETSFYGDIVHKIEKKYSDAPTLIQTYLDGYFASDDKPWAITTKQGMTLQSSYLKPAVEYADDIYNIYAEVSELSQKANRSITAAINELFVLLDTH